MSETKPEYGPHQFEPTRPPAPPHEIVLDGPLPELRCKLCGALKDGISDDPSWGENAQADPNLCGCNPIIRQEIVAKEAPRRERYGRHHFDHSNPTYMGFEYAVYCKLCGASLISPANSGSGKISGGSNPQSNSDCCGCRPLSQNELVDMTYRLEFERDNAVRDLARFKQRLAETVADLLK